MGVAKYYSVLPGKKKGRDKMWQGALQQVLFAQDTYGPIKILIHLRMHVVLLVPVTVGLLERLLGKL